LKKLNYKKRDLDKHFRSRNITSP